MSEKRLQKRDEISDEYKLKLEDMYETDELWRFFTLSLPQLAEKLSGFKGHLADSAATLLDFFKMCIRDSPYAVAEMLFKSVQSTRQIPQNIR